MPEIVLKEEIEGAMAEKLQRCFAPGVIELEEKDGRLHVIFKSELNTHMN